MTYLLDNNVLQALAHESHIHYNPATDWLESVLVNHSFATCPLTQIGFLRISCHTYAKTLAEAQEQLSVFLDHPRHVFWPAGLDARDLMGTPGQLTDLYLVNLAKENNGKFATFDQAWKKNSAAYILSAD